MTSHSQSAVLDSAHIGDIRGAFGTRRQRLADAAAGNAAAGAFLGRDADMAGCPARLYHYRHADGRLQACPTGAVTRFELE